MHSVDVTTRRKEVSGQDHEFTWLAVSAVLVTFRQQFGQGERSTSNEARARLARQGQPRKSLACSRGEAGSSQGGHGHGDMSGQVDELG